ncbi:uncharacterized protein LOC134724772 isoform X2 [Mytilus trossulus]|uniref:uncharacterized protein LOC134724772 isoform X2 n=1 Tax=Mytilus trossulus TaxID=6551 RepID=UPI003007018F
MFDVFYCVILNTIVHRFVNGDQLSLVVSAGQSKWKEAFGSCNDSIYWHQLSNYCQPDSCNDFNFTDTIINKPKFGRQEYWIYGYVLRSPVIGNMGCFSLNTSLKSGFHRGNFSFGDNSATKCSRACPNKTEYIFMRDRECLCIPLVNFHQHNTYSEENTGACKNTCDGNSRDLCGNATSTEGKEMYSVYKIVSRRISKVGFGDTCTKTILDEKRIYKFIYTTCTAEQNYICERFDKSTQTYPETCHYETVSWNTAQESCQEQGLHLRLHTSTTPTCLQGHNFWSGDHIVDQIVWANDTLPTDALCLKLVITESGSSFETENCSTSLYSLCSKQHHTSSSKNDEAFTTPSTQSYSSTGRTTYGSSFHTKSDSVEQNTKQFGRITIRSPVNAESGSDEDKTDFIPLVAGSVGGFVAIVIVVIVVCIIQRRKKSNHRNLNTAVDHAEPETYSEPIKNTVPEESRKLVVENTIPEENLKLVNVTEEGIYNHLGDSEKMIEMKPQDSSIYDVTGDDEYHVFTGNGKQTTKDDDDLYDRGGAASDVYNTLNDTVTPNRPESDTYNVINAK